MQLGHYRGLLPVITFSQTQRQEFEMIVKCKNHVYLESSERLVQLAVIYIVFAQAITYLNLYDEGGECKLGFTH